MFPVEMLNMGIDATDRKLIFLLDGHARASLGELARALRVSREGVNYRMGKLRREGVVRGFVTKADISRAGLTNYAVFFKLANLSKKEHAAFVKELAARKEITWMASLGGQFDLAFEITCGSAEGFEEALSSLLYAHSSKVSDYHVSTKVAQEIFGRKYLWPEKIVPSAPAGKKAVVAPDGLDCKILSAMSGNARISFMDLGKEVGAPPSTVALRLRQMERKGLVSGYTTFTDLHRLGYTRFKALVSVRDFSKEFEAKMRAYCMQHPKIYYYSKNFGSWNYEIEVDAQSPPEYQGFLMEFRSRFPAIQEIQSFSIFEEHKYGYWPG